MLPAFPFTVRWRDKDWIVTELNDSRVQLAVQLEGAAYKTQWAKAAVEVALERGLMTLVT